MTESFTFRFLTEGDLPLLLEWFRRPHGQEVWDETPSLEEALDKYLPRTKPHGHQPAPANREAIFSSE